MIPNHVLLIGGPDTGKLQLSNVILNNQHIEGVEEDSHSGLMVKTNLSTKYYNVDINLLIDEYPSERSMIKDNEESLKYDYFREWYDEFISLNCKELRDVLDGIIFSINIDQDSVEYISQCIDLLNDLKDLLNREYDEWSGFFAVTGVTNTKRQVDEVEDIVLANGFEFIYLNEHGQNEFKDKIGKDRLLELFQSHEWKNIEFLDSETNYKTNKMATIERNQMTEKLLNDYDEDPPDDKLDISDILTKLKLAKDKANGLNNENEKESYVNKIIDDVIDYL